MKNVRGLYITNVPQDTANAYRLIQKVLADDYNYDREEDEIEDIIGFLTSDRNYLCDMPMCKSNNIYNWVNYVKPSNKHIVMTYNEFVQKYLGLTQDQLKYEIFYSFKTKLAADSEYANLFDLAVNNKMYEYSLFNRYVALASEHFNRCLTEEQCKLIQIAQDIIK